MKRHIGQFAAIVSLTVAAALLTAAPALAHNGEPESLSHTLKDLALSGAWVAAVLVAVIAFFWVRVRLLRSRK